MLSNAEILRKTAIFRNMSPETETILENLKENVFSAGEKIVDAQDFESFRGLGVLLSGKAYVFGKNREKEVLLNRLAEADVFGAATVFFREKEAVSTVSAKTKCRILFIERSLLEKIMENDFAVASAYIAFLSERVYFLNRKIIGFTAKSADCALADYVLRAADENGLLTVNMSRIASSLNIGRTTLYRVLEILRDEGVLAYDGKKIRILDRELLEKRSKG
ncbi:MAG: Crp/Fnr family transcriptional regulator [Ruminococcaceae bacterium]|nr:Crp/Fnr family transcriptional regulator [Oscillospiraceae bacterium]